MILLVLFVVTEVVTLSLIVDVLLYFGPPLDLAGVLATKEGGSSILLTLHSEALVTHGVIDGDDVLQPALPGRRIFWLKSGGSSSLLIPLFVLVLAL